MYQEISANKQKTTLLMVLMSSLVLGLAFIGLRISGLDTYSAAVFGGGFTIVYALISYFVSDKIALSVAGAKEIQKADAPELYSLIENLTIASGLPMPRVYVIDDDAPNAFATGRDPAHSSVAFTTGILRRLEKSELEGVAAHELSHIGNYDIRVMTIVVVLVGAISLIADLILRSRFRSRDDREGGAGALIIVGIVLALLSPLIANLIKLAVSRQREYLADASGALLTRYPEGLASALEKISQSDVPLKNANSATAHLYISNPFGSKGNWLNLLSTHPPIAERIAKLRSMGQSH